MDSWNTRFAQQEAGSNGVGGYRLVRIDGIKYLAHRICFYLYHGFVPNEIDHVDRVKTNNARHNLRVATHWQNKGNSGLNRNNISGVKGVSWAKKEGKWRAQIRQNGNAIYLGCYAQINDAAAAYEKAAIAYFGEFVALNGTR